MSPSQDRVAKTTLVSFSTFQFSLLWQEKALFQGLCWVLYWLVLGANLTQTGVITKKGASVEEVPP